MSGIIARPAIATTIIEKTAVTSVRHSAMNSRMLIDVPIEKTMKGVTHLPTSAMPACLMMSGGMTPVTKQMRKRNKLTKTEESFAFVRVPSTSPMPKKSRTRKR